MVMMNNSKSNNFKIYKQMVGNRHDVVKRRLGQYKDTQIRINSVVQAFDLCTPCGGLANGEY